MIYKVAPLDLGSAPHVSAFRSTRWQHQIRLKLLITLYYTVVLKPTRIAFASEGKEINGSIALSDRRHHSDLQPKRCPNIVPSAPGTTDLARFRSDCCR